MSSAGINAINSGPLIMRVNPSSATNNTYVVGKYDFPISSNFVLITSSDGTLAPTNAPYISTFSGSSIATDYATVNSSLTARSIGFSSITGSSIITDYATVNSSLTGSSISARNIGFSSITGSSLVTNFATVNSTLSGSTITARSINFSTILGSSIVTNFATVNSTLTASSFIAQDFTISSVISNTISTNFITVNSTLTGSTITGVNTTTNFLSVNSTLTASTLSCSTIKDVSTINSKPYYYVSSGTCYSDYLFWNGTSWGLGGNEVHIGCNSGLTGQAQNTVAIGNGAGQNTQSQNAVAIGTNAGQNSQSASAIAIGNLSGVNVQGQNAIAIGRQSGNTGQTENSIAIGRGAGQQNQGTSAIAIGAYAGQNSQHASSIIINGLNSTLNSQVAAALYIAPIRNQDATSTLYYNSTTNEITHGNSFWQASGTNKMYNNLNFSSIGINGVPNYPLDVNGYTRIYSSMDTSTSQLVLGGSAATIGNFAYSVGIESQWGSKATGGINAASDMVLYTHGNLFGVPMDERMRIKYDGKVGIGTSTPTALLDVAGSVNISSGLLTVNSTISSNNGDIIMAGGKLVVSKLPLQSGQTLTPNVRLNVNGDVNFNSGYDGIARLILGPTPGGSNQDYCSLITSEDSYSSNYGSQLGFWTHDTTSNTGSPTRRMTITNTGNVGIGTTTPNATLHVSNNSAVASDFALLVSSSSSNAFSINNSGGISINNNTATNFATSLTFRKSYNYGASNSGELGYIQFNGTNASLASVRGAYISANQVGTANTHTPTELQFWTSIGTSEGQRMTITSGGNVGIGMTSPYSRLHVATEVGTAGFFKGVGVNRSDVNTFIGAYTGGPLSNAGSIQVTSNGDNYDPYTLAINPLGGDIYLGNNTSKIYARAELSCSSITNVSTINGNSVNNNITISSIGAPSNPYTVTLSNYVNTTNCKVVMKAVGGGGGGGGGQDNSSTPDLSGAGGGSGYETEAVFIMPSNTVLLVTLGVGGSGGVGGTTGGTGVDGGSTFVTTNVSGLESSFIIFANGGKGGTKSIGGDGQYGGGGGGATNSGIVRSGGNGINPQYNGMAGFGSGTFGSAGGGGLGGGVLVLNNSGTSGNQYLSGGGGGGQYGGNGGFPLTRTPPTNGLLGGGGGGGYISSPTIGADEASNGANGGNGYVTLAIYSIS
jgi:hypothetical protein